MTRTVRMTRRGRTVCGSALILAATLGCHRRVDAPRALPKVAPAAASEPVTLSPLNEALRAELRAMARDDADETSLNLDGSTVADSAAASSVSVRERNVARLRAIIQEHGWPGNSLVGREGARAAWLIAQHADFDVPFQRECLRLVEGAYLRSDVDGHDLAYLADRVAAAEGRAPVYGTQGGHGYTPEQAALIDQRRRAVGLPSLSEFRAMAARGESQRIHEPGW